MGRLTAVGKWLAKSGEAVYGKVTRAAGRTESMPTGGWTQKGKTAYYWCSRWPGRELAIGGLRTTVVKASLLTTGKPVRFEQTQDRLVFKGLPPSCPDRTAGVCVIKLECKSRLRQVLGAGCVVL